MHADGKSTLASVSKLNSVKINFDLFSSRYVRWEGISVKSFVRIFALCYSCTQVTLSYILSCTFTFTLTWYSLSVHFLKTALNFKVVKQHCWSAFTFYFSIIVVPSIILTVSFTNTASSWLTILLIRSGNIHPYPGQTHNQFSFCHLNLNGLMAHDKLKITLLEAYNTVYNYDVIAISESQLRSSVENTEIHTEGFSHEVF